jgi:hypothetical protein
LFIWLLPLKLARTKQRQHIKPGRGSTLPGCC